MLCCFMVQTQEHVDFVDGLIQILPHINGTYNSNICGILVLHVKPSNLTEQYYVIILA